MLQALSGAGTRRSTSGMSSVDLPSIRFSFDGIERLFQMWSPFQELTGVPVVLYSQSQTLRLPSIALADAGRSSGSPREDQRATSFKCLRLRQTAGPAAVAKSSDGHGPMPVKFRPTTTLLSPRLRYLTHH